MSAQPVRAVAFDAVGTLIHPEPSAAEVYAEIGRRLGSRLDVAEVRARFRTAFAKQERIDVQSGLVTSEAREVRRWQDIVTEVLDDVSDPGRVFAELYEHFARPAAWRCDDGVADCFARLRREGYAIALASNYDHRLRGVVAGLEALAAVPILVISSEIGWRKPAPGFFAHLAEALRLPPEAILHVGDNWGNDLRGARGAGMHALLFDPRGRHSAPPHDRLDDLRDLRLPRLCG